MADDNPILTRRTESKSLAPTDKDERVRHWIEKGNAYLWGHAPATEGKMAGTFIDTPRPDLEWVWRNGSYAIEARR